MVKTVKTSPQSPSTTAPPPLRVGSLARAAGVKVETIRYYQQRGLLPTPPRPPGGQRLYPAALVERLRFIKRAQGLGFSLDDIASLVKLDDGVDHARARATASHRLKEIDLRIADLTAMRDTLRKLIRDCEHASGKIPCPIIRAVSPAA